MSLSEGLTTQTLNHATSKTYHTLRAAERVRSQSHDLDDEDAIDRGFDAEVQPRK